MVVSPVTERSHRAFIRVVFIGHLYTQKFSGKEKRRVLMDRGIHYVWNIHMGVYESLYVCKKEAHT